MDTPDPPASLHALPTEVLDIIFNTSLTNISPVPATAIAGAERFIAFRAWRGVCRLFREVLKDVNQAASVQGLLANGTFRFDTSAELLHIIPTTPPHRLQHVRSVEVECGWMIQNYRGVHEAVRSRQRQEMPTLTSLPNLRFLRVCLGPLDDGDDYGYRQWMARSLTSREVAYTQAIRFVSESLRNLPLAVVVEVIIDSHAGWDGPERWREARALVRLRYKQTSPGIWMKYAEPDEQEEQVAWKADTPADHARERLIGAALAWRAMLTR